jgi:HEAT repeat protein
MAIREFPTRRDRASVETFLGNVSGVESVVEHERRRKIDAIDNLRDGGVAERRTLTEYLGDPDPVVREFAAEALGHDGGETEAKALVPLLADPDQAVRWTAAEALGRLRFVDATTALARTLTADANALVRADAAESLGDIGVRPPEVDAALIAAVLSDRSYLVRGYSADALARLHAIDSVPLLQQRLRRERNSWTRAWLFGALYRLGDREALPALLRLLGRVKTPAMRSAILSLLERIMTTENENAIYVGLARLFEREPAFFDEQERWWEKLKTQLASGS